MLIVLLVAVACGVLAYRRGRRWWLWPFAGVVIDLAVAIGLAVAAKKLQIDPRFASGNNVGILSAAVVLLLPPIVALVVVSVLTRVSDRKPPRARAARAAR